MATIRIGRNESMCLSCNKSASPDDNGHEMIYGWDMRENGNLGCGEPWTAVEMTNVRMLTTSPPQLKPDVGYVYENLRGLPMVGYATTPEMVYPNDEQLTVRR